MLRIVFCSDTIFRLPNLRLPFSLLMVDLAANKRSVRRVAQLDAAIACFGHGKPLTQDTAQALGRFVQRVGAG